MRDLVVTRAADADLLEIWTYLFERSEQAAERVTDEIVERYELLLQHPMIGRSRPEIGPRYRSLSVGKYVIFYRVTESKLEISRVLHGARDITAIFEPESNDISD